jgi:hypothetical protein
LVPENQRWRLPVGSCETDVVYERAGDPRLDALLILAHGAGDHRSGGCNSRGRYRCRAL